MKTVYGNYKLKSYRENKTKNRHGGTDLWSQHSGRQKQVYFYKFKAGLVYIENSSQPGIQRETLS